MNKILEQGVEAVRELPDERQIIAGRVLLALAAETDTSYQLTTEQEMQVRESMAEADRREFASDEAMAAFWRRYGV